MVFESGFSVVPGFPKLPSIDPATISYLFGISLPTSLAHANAACHPTSQIGCNPQESSKRQNLQHRILVIRSSLGRTSARQNIRAAVGTISGLAMLNDNVRSTKHFQHMCLMREIQVRIRLIF